MGKCKSQYTVVLVFLVVFSTSCTIRDRSRLPVVITSIVLTENSIIIEIEQSRVAGSVDGLSITYKNILSGMFFDIQVKEERH